MEIGQRLTLMIDCNNLDAGTVVTLESIQDKMGIVRYDYEESGSKFKGIPISFLRPASKDEITKTNYRKLVDKSLWIGARWRTHIKLFKDAQKGMEVVVSNVELAENAGQDYITVEAIGLATPSTMMYASALQDYCIPINPELEDSLAEELADNGTYIYMRPGERVLYNNQVVTIIETDEQTGKLKVCPNMEQFSKLEVSISEVRTVVPSDLSSIDYKQIISGIKLGDKLKSKLDIPLESFDQEAEGLIEKGDEIEILTVSSISNYALEDKFIIDLNGKRMELAAYDIVTYFDRV